MNSDKELKLFHSLSEKNAEFSISYTIKTLFILYNITYGYKTNFLIEQFSV